MAIALVLLIDMGTDYGEQGPGIVPPMFDGRASVTMAIIYIIALVVYPFLSGWTSWIAATVAIAAASYTVSGVVAGIAMLGLLGGMIGVAYMGPALMLVVFSLSEAVIEIRARRGA